MLWVQSFIDKATHGWLASIHDYSGIVLQFPWCGGGCDADVEEVIYDTRASTRSVRAKTSDVAGQSANTGLRIGSTFFQVRTYKKTKYLFYRSTEMLNRTQRTTPTFAGLASHPSCHAFCHSLLKVQNKFTVVKKFPLT